MSDREFHTQKPEQRRLCTHVSMSEIEVLISWCVGVECWISCARASASSAFNLTLAVSRASTRSNSDMSLPLLLITMKQYVYLLSYFLHITIFYKIPLVFCKLQAKHKWFWRVSNNPLNIFVFISICKLTSQFLF